MTTHSQALPISTLIGQYEIKAILGAGSFAITYRAWDHQLHRDVAIKEFLPSALTQREFPALLVQARPECVDDYARALQNFLVEARILAKFTHPNVVRVVAYLEKNNTAYLIMEFEEGETLAEHIKRAHGPLSQQACLSIFLPLLQGLQTVHQAHFLHRDIKPGNIYLRRNGEPVWIDFGASRELIEGHSQNMTGIVTPGYAASEQYSIDSKKQGPWTDLYSVGATLYRCALGVEPAPTPARAHALMDGDADPLQAAVVLGAGRFDEAFLQSIDWMLMIPIKSRPQNVSQVLQKLAQAGLLSAAQGRDVVMEDWEKRDPNPTVILKEHEKGFDEDDGQGSATARNRKQARVFGLPLFAVIAVGGYSLLAPHSLWESFKKGNEALPLTSQDNLPVTAGAEKAQGASTYPVRLDVTPAGAEILVNGQPWLPETPLEEGRYAIAISAEGYYPYLGEISVGPGNGLDKIHLAPRVASVKEHSAVESYKSPLLKRLKLALVAVPAGSFQVHATENNRGLNRNPPVGVAAFNLMKYEVTQGQWLDIMGSNPAYFTDCGLDCPVEQVSWNDIQGFITRLNQMTGMHFRLPTEVEWEYACRSGGKEQIYCGGEALNSLAWYAGNSGQRTRPVGKKEPNGLGLYDMSGNVWEWTQGCYQGGYSTLSKNGAGTENTVCARRVLRGGSWFHDSDLLAADYRYSNDASYRLYNGGFRLVQVDE